jgi:branched-chain amino acid transport system ATP-binding protein
MLKIDNVTAGYGEQTVLRDVSLEAPPGQVVALLGPNGAGKTTLLRVASGLLSPSAGAVLLDGQDATSRGAPWRARSGVCHIPEGRGVFPTLTVKENLTLFSPKGRERESIERAADTFPAIGSRLNQVAGRMSGGEQQMLAIVRAYLSESQLVLIDEASLGLAPIIVDQLFAFMRQITKEGKALLLVEQYVSRALEMADTAYLLNRGRIVLQAPAADLQGQDVFERYLGIEV